MPFLHMQTLLGGISKLILVRLGVSVHDVIKFYYSNQLLEQKNEVKTACNK